ncbi:MAG: response regulator, partial [Candidatus Omnitrophica bacterium]|nr:response regulator [Candidatus Omnitrophota bacterium]
MNSQAGSMATLQDEFERSLPPPRVLVVDDDQDFAETLRDILEPKGYQVEVSHTGTGALQAAVEFEPQVALIDIRL